MAENCFWRELKKVTTFCSGEAGLQPDTLLPGGYFFVGVGANANIVVIIAEEGKIFTNTTDLSDGWTERSHPLQDSTTIPHNIVWTGTEFVIAGNWNADRKVLYSADGISWSLGADLPNLGGVAYWHDAHVMGNNIVVVGNDVAAIGTRDGWSGENLPSTVNWFHVAASDTVAVAFAESTISNVMRYNSVSGWEYHFTGISIGSIRSACYNGSVWIGSKITGEAIISSDAENWSSLTIPQAPIGGVYSLEALADGTIVAFGLEGQTQVSTDNGQTWGLGFDMGDLTNLVEYSTCSYENTYFAIDNQLNIGARGGAVS